MKKIFIIIASVLIILGSGLFITAIAANDFDVNKTFSEELEKVTYSIDDDFSAIEADILESDISFVSSEDEKNSITYFENNLYKDSVDVVEGKLIFKRTYSGNWFDSIKISLSNTYHKVEVRVNKKQFSDLIIRGKSGNITIDNGFVFDNMNLQTNSGNILINGDCKGSLVTSTKSGSTKINNIDGNDIDISIKSGNVVLENVQSKASIKINSKSGSVKLINVRCGDTSLNLSSGSIHLNDVICTNIFASTKSGNIKFSKIDASKLEFTSKSGGISGSILSEKIFIVNSNSGNISVPETINGGIFKATTKSGNINIIIENK